MSEFEKRRQHLKNMSEEDLKKYFWELCDKATQPLVDFAAKHTSPSIERSVLLRMGFNSLEAKEIVIKINEAGLLGKGAGNVIYKLSEKMNISCYKAGKWIITEENPDLKGIF
ncbi:MAG: ornithine aminomutase subunit alpha [Candidatus Muirbacterium halophilum]|nr:ornithine aminomutase subunit alpha [Candidatus Muirbacterium halophilum]MCK9474558.1 ornithine aminomutase subunit alpha [Candidatus Muirbacterium halophilum]